jgi:tetrathionate reductase subunit B
VETCPTKARIFGDLNDPESEVSQLTKKEKLVQIINPLVNTQPNIIYFNNATRLDWPTHPTLPGGAHMPPGFWKTYG